MIEDEGDKGALPSLAVSSIDSSSLFFEDEVVLLALEETAAAAGEGEGGGFLEEMLDVLRFRWTTQGSS